MTRGSLHVALTTTRLLVVYQIIFCSCDKSGSTYRYTIILSEPLWIDEALAALGCTSLGSVGDDGLVDTTCDNSTYVYEVRHYAAWTGLLTQVSKLPDHILENVTLFGIGIPVVSSIRAVEREVWFGLLSMVAAIAPSFSALDMSWCTKKSATISSKPLNRVCLSFHLHEAIFVAAAGAALIPWSADKTKAFGVLSDRSVSVENDDVFKAFVSGATFIDPDVVVNRLAIRSTAPPGSLALNRTVQVEVRRLLEIMPVVYIDLADAASIEAALEVVQEVSTLRGTITNAWAILPPGICCFR